MFFNFFDIFSLFSAKIEIAKIDELIAPGIPIAIVATGQPFGICTIEYKLSIPESADDNIGTPITGNKVFDATIPGK